jgi:hypothetical protein
MPTIVDIRPDAFLFDGVDLDSLRREPDILSLLGQFDRHEDIRCQPSGYRRRMVWDSRGLVAYSDYPEDRLSHIQIAFDPEETPSKPSVAADVEVHLNGKILTRDTTEATLPRLGPTPVIEDHHMYFFCPGTFRVDFAFRRRRNKVGKKSGVPKLAYISFSWRLEKRANQALQTTPMTRSVYEKTTEFGHPQRGV